MFSNVNVLFLAAVCACVLHEVTCDVFTSMTRIKDMVLNEGQILNKIKTAIPATLSDPNSDLSRFYQQRDLIVKGRNLTRERERLNHPNGVYTIIKEFNSDYQSLRDAMKNAGIADVNKILTDVADSSDLDGARESLIRLQEVYDLQPIDLVQGRYLTYKGPALNSTDAYLIGKTAFRIQKYRQAIQWLNAALHLMKQQTGLSDLEFQPFDVTSFGRIGPSRSSELTDATAFLGRSFLKIGKRELAREQYSKLNMGDLDSEEAVNLREELDQFTAAGDQSVDQEQSMRKFYDLCKLQSQTTLKFRDPRLRCRYAFILLPYYRFNEEIVSNRPYVSVFHDVITSSHMEVVKQETVRKLYRGKIAPDQDAGTESSVRTSHLAFINDDESKTAEFISKRISYLAHLNTYIGAAEAHQVVNYGLGGHYTVHLDSFLVKRKQKHIAEYMDKYGNRLATFLIYLTDVERGGSTAFPDVDLVISPEKGKAVFWYNYNPDGEIDYLTHHAGCPVLVGEKWIINKWIWTYENIFKRRCGLKPNLTQLDIERDMARGYRPKKKETFNQKINQ